VPSEPATPAVPQAAFDALRGAVGVAIGHRAAPLQCSVDLAVAAEAGGMDLVSVGDSEAETTTLLAAIAGRTEQVGLLSGIAQWTRTPATLSHTAKTVQSLAAGRYTLGIGPMPRPWTEDHHGLEHEPAGSRMRDYVAATRAALAATKAAPTAHEGPFFRTLGYPGTTMTPDRAVPIHLAATRPRMTAIAAEIADGVLLNSIQPLPWIADVGARAIAEGLERAGRPRERFAVGLLRFCGIDDDRAVAYDHARRNIAFYFRIPYFRALLEPYGFGAELDAGEAALARGDAEAQAAAVSDEMVDALALAGTPDEVVAKLRRVQEHVDYVVVGGVLGQSWQDGREQTMRLIETFGPVARRGAWTPVDAAARADGTVPDGARAPHDDTPVELRSSGAAGDDGAPAALAPPPEVPPTGAPLRRAYVTTAHGQLHLRELGEGPPVVLLHQTASSSVQWERTMRLLPPGRRYVAIDTPGFGGSDAPGPEHPDLAWYADRIGEAIDGLGLSSVALVGHHTGAMIAAELAVRRPELIERLALIGCVVIEDPAEQELAVAHVNRWELDARGDFVADTLIPRLAVSVTTDDPEQMQQELAAYIQAGPDYAKAYDAVWRYDAHLRLPRITAPTLVLEPVEEPDDLRGWTVRAAELIPGAELRSVDGGTEIAFQRPGTLAAGLTDFLLHPAYQGTT